MKAYLLDTHIVIWLLENDKRLSKKLLNIITDNHNEFFISYSSIWEITSKQAKGKLGLPENYLQSYLDRGFKLLPINLDEILRTKDLPNIHSDPFDRILVTQANLNNLTLISSDPKILSYDCKKLVN